LAERAGGDSVQAWQSFCEYGGVLEVSSLYGRRALVTGAGMGIGRAIARALTAAGAKVAITDLDLSSAEDVAAELGNPAVALRLDVTDAAATDAVIREVADRLGGLEIVCANAGVSTMNYVVDLTEAEWDHNLGVNAKGVFLTNQAAVRHWLAAGVRGVIVNTASLAGKQGVPLLAHYSASKFAVVGFTQALAREVAAHGIRVNCVCPGLVRTSMQEREVVWEAKLRSMSREAVIDDYVSMTPLGRLEEPEDVADAVVFLASDAARFITGEALNVTGGVRMD
jgi:meso-butanediol dehydrogenase/(S,S)-butanediol dehydrogenase/diacetyl reductase